MYFFFFKQKTAYEMRISDWSSDVCSSDLFHDRAAIDTPQMAGEQAGAGNLRQQRIGGILEAEIERRGRGDRARGGGDHRLAPDAGPAHRPDRTSTRLNSSH